jgi:glycine cleavage system aminomethyltransferase T
MVGYVTSGCYSHLVEKPLCFAWVQTSVAKDARVCSVHCGVSNHLILQLTVNMRNELVTATILAKPPAAAAQ